MDMQIRKSVIFISHSSKDKELASELKRQIELCFDSTLEAFAANIEPSENWFDKVMQKLRNAQAIVLLITPQSVSESHWVWFELGYFWARREDTLTNQDEMEKVYYPLYISDVSLPGPVRDLQIQAASLDDENEIRAFFSKLCGQFDSGNVAKVDIASIVARVSEVSGEKPSDIDIKALLEEHLRTVDRKNWLRYSKVDTELGLPSGSSARLLKEVALEMGIKKCEETETMIRFPRRPVFIGVKN